MAGKERGSIIEQVVASRTQKDIRAASVEKARQELPAFKGKLNQLIVTHVPKPEIREVTFEERLQMHLRISYKNEGRRERNMDTVLEAKTPTPKGEIEVTIKSSDYPLNTLDDNAKNNIAYAVDVLDLDHILEIDRGEAKLKSKVYRAGPKSEEDADKEELDRYSNLLDILSDPNSGTTFKGRTSEIIIAKPIEFTRKPIPTDIVLPKPHSKK